MPVGRQDDALDYVFVMTYGRSGSTLLQGILNSIPGYLIRGENRQVMRHLYDFHRTAWEERKGLRRRPRRRGDEPGTSSPVHPFYGLDAYPGRVALRGIRRLALDTLLRPEPDTRVTGFKEIRWAEEDIAEYVAWLREVFPGARFVVNTRDLTAVSGSKWWADHPGALEELQMRERRILGVAETLGDDAFHVHYDDYQDDVEALAPLFAWLGEGFDADRVRQVIDVPHSY